jgi:hypothetical protein
MDKGVSAREWMEEIEKCEGPKCGIGAYTVLRCDVSYPAIPNRDNSWDEIRWNVWGEEYHKDRLSSSYTSLAGDSCHDQSRNETNQVIRSLLREATKSLYEFNGSKTIEGSIFHRTLMLTVLWTPQQPLQPHITVESSRKRPTIRAHASFAGPPRSFVEDHMPSSITACLALPEELTIDALEALPHRYYRDGIMSMQSSIGATAKISSWCRIRRPIEDPERYKEREMNVSEVLLVNQYMNTTSYFMDSLEILEGLTSNLFVIYKDGTVRTADTTKVLPGYSRYLVLKALRKLKLYGDINLTLDERAPTIQDGIAGLWSEVFLTSSIRLLIPVTRIFIPSVKTVGEKSIANPKTVIWEGNDVLVNTRIIRDIEIEIGFDESTSYTSADIM